MSFFRFPPVQPASPRGWLAACRTAAAACLLIAVGPAGFAGPITYNFVNYPDFQEGYSLTGSIITDGTLGDFDQTHINAWHFTITGMSITSSADSTNSGAYVSGNFSATLTELKLADPPTGNETLVSIQGNSLLFWQHWALGVPAASLYYSRTATGPLTTFWHTYDPYPYDWTIAVASAPVPEIDPSSFGSALAMLMGSLGLVERRARRVLGLTTVA